MSGSVILNPKVPVESVNTERMIQPVGEVIKLDIPTPYGGTEDNQLVHLAIVRIPQKLSGYKYWGAFTPYPASDETKENPCIAASNDGITWEVPTGVTNPLFGPPETGFYADTSLIWDNTNLILHWAHNANGVVSTYQSTSTNGITWTEPVEMVPALSDDYPVYDFSNQITRVFSMVGKGRGFEITQRYLRGQTLTDADGVLSTNLQGLVHHPMVVADQAGWHFIFPCYWAGDTDAKNLYYGFSYHGFNAVFDPVPIVTPNDDLPVANTKGIYTGTIAQSPKKDIYYLYFTAVTTDSFWWVGMVPVKFNSLAIAQCTAAANLPVNMLLFSDEIRDSVAHYLNFQSYTPPMWNRYKHKALIISNSHNTHIKLYVTGLLGTLSGDNVKIDGVDVSPIIFTPGYEARITETTNKLLSYMPGEYLRWKVYATDANGEPAVPTTGFLKVLLTMWN